MERMKTNEVVCRCFVMIAPGLRSRIHFFPTAGNTGGHYPVVCSLTMYGKGFEKRTVQLDGGRINQPDGLRLEDAFSGVHAEHQSLFGLDIGLSVAQGRLNLLPSQVFVESVSPQLNLLYSGAPFAGAGGIRDHRPEGVEQGNRHGSEARAVSGRRIGMVALEEDKSASLVIVNGSDAVVKPQVSFILEGAETSTHLGTVAANSVFEFPLKEVLAQGALRHHTLVGDLSVARLVCNLFENIDQVEIYVLYRHTDSKIPCAVTVL